jgi:hypothetical protein
MAGRTWTDSRRLRPRRTVEALARGYAENDNPHQRQRDLRSASRSSRLTCSRSVEPGPAIDERARLARPSGRLRRRSEDARTGRAASVRRRAIGARRAPASVRRQQQPAHCSYPCEGAAPGRSTLWRGALSQCANGGSAPSGSPSRMLGACADVADRDFDVEPRAAARIRHVLFSGEWTLMPAGLRNVPRATAGQVVQLSVRGIR